MGLASRIDELLPALTQRKRIDGEERRGSNSSEVGVAVGGGKPAGNLL